MENFADAAGRHWLDAQLLERETRYQNADQLYGIAAECALKAALITATSNRDENSGLRKDYKTHIDVLWDRIGPSAFPRHLPSLQPLLKMENPFSDWGVEQRYWENGTVDPATLDKHKSMTRRLVFAAGIIGTRNI